VAGSGAAAAFDRRQNPLGGISKRGYRYLRPLLINGASANLLRSKATNADRWVIGPRRRRPSLVVAVALANKAARIAWAVMRREESYRHRSAARHRPPANRCLREGNKA
jgi:transposase